MAGIYIHIPFCTQKCHYCNFFSQPAIHLIPQYVDALCKELELRKDYLSEPVSTIYFGGGTPGLLQVSHIEKILSTINHHYKNNAFEITLEVNPDDINRDYLIKIRKAGINRLSIGIQSLDDGDLKWLNRRHSAQQAIDAFQQARECGFDNISIDLIYGIPVQNTSRWEEQVSKVLRLKPEHISAYALTVEPGTALHHFIQTGQRPDVDEEHALQCFMILKDHIEDLGYQQYEVSNYCLPGRESQHNSSYWNQIPYLGVGASAHSYNGNSRQWNVAAINKYITNINDGYIPSEKEELNLVDKFNEYIMTALRTAKGCNLSHINTVYGKDYVDMISTEAEQFVREGLLIREDDYLRTAKKGWFHLDGIAASLFANIE